MNKDLYEILGVDKNATQEKIKKTYRKLALEWHPDKFATKSLEEREQANERMQELNKAYEILGDEELRERYNSGETDFTPEFDWDSYYEAEKARIEAELERAAAERKKIQLMTKILTYQQISNEISLEIHFKDIYPENLNSDLWVPYSSWEEKLRSFEVFVVDDGSIIDVDKVKSHDIFEFKTKMIDAIKKRREELDNGINDPWLNKSIKQAIETIESNLKRKNLKAEDLDERYRDYRKHINSLIKIYKVRDFRDEVIKNIIAVSRRKDYENKIEQQPKGFLWKDLIFFRSSNNSN